MPKRRAQEIEEQDNEAVSTPPSKRSRRVQLDDTTPSKKTKSKATPLKSTPTKSTPSKTRKPLSQNDENLQESTPQKAVTTPKSGRGKGKVVFATPTKPVDPDGKNVFVVRNADRSARRRSTRNLIERAIAGEESEEEAGVDLLGQDIFRDNAEEEEESGEEDEEGQEEDPEQPAESTAAETPSKRGRGRPKGAKRKRTPTPPPNLPPHERYFFENRPTGAKSSSNTLSPSDLISHSAYHSAISSYDDPHASSIENLHTHHESSFPLWRFELSQQFTICLYGYGSKRRLLTSFATYLHFLSPEQPPATIIINGHHPSLTLRSLLNTLAAAVLPSISTTATKLPTQPGPLTTHILNHLISSPPKSPIYLLISTLHTKPLSTPASLSILSQLSSHPHIHLVCTADNPSFPLLFPAPLRSTFNFLFHDATTFLPYDTGAADSELSTVVDSVLELLGRKTSAVQGREGVKWVLRSLPENARGLYRVLVGEILAAADIDGDVVGFDAGVEENLIGVGEDGVRGEGSGGGGRRKGTTGGVGREGGGLPAIDAKMLYQKAVEEFLCSSEMMFWSLLKEFVDHRMVVVRRERGVGVAGGGEMLGIEMGREELEGVLEDLIE
ncbi:Origin recognition complex subunit 2 [Thelotrema lepadinum]|nr:Origin recognition complex subunit 2 [Thelotrema lepadinum]